MTPGTTKSSLDPAPSFTEIAPYYDELMKDVPYRFWARYVLTVADRFDCKPTRILDLACGTGAVTMLLAEQGFEMAGVDGSAEMLAIAREKAAASGRNISFIHADLRSYSAPGLFDLVICLYDSLNNILNPGDLERTFKCVRESMAPDALFVFDVNTDYALRANLFTQENRDPAIPIRYRWESHYDYPTRICTVNMDFWVTEGGRERAFSEVHRQRAYSRADLERMLDEAGITLLGAYDGLSFRPPLPRTDRMYCVARRKPAGSRD
ncbi:MAG TPA: class I SAM-dependent methyltransferase [Armatimonadota bacterium]|nr:class I SAM-dependent methyltransferase [Armatimonadota bacterium]